MIDRVDPRRVEAVIFDFAGVLTVSPRKMMGARAERAGRRFEDVMPIMLGPVDEDTDHPWHRAERGEITLAEFAAYSQGAFVEAGMGDELSPPTPEEIIASLHPVPEMVAAAEIVRAAGYPTAILSNNIREWSAWRSVVDADRLVDVVVDSSEVGMRKPSVQVYELTAARLGVSSAACLMMDDFEWNVRGAQRAGMQAVLVTDPVVDSAGLLHVLGL